MRYLRGVTALKFSRRYWLELHSNVFAPALLSHPRVTREEGQEDENKCARQMVMVRVRNKHFAKTFKYR